MSRLAYFTRETLISLRRNLLMTIAGIMTVAVSLFLFGGILLVSRTVDHGTNKWKHGVELEIFMKVKASRRADRRGRRASSKPDPQRQELPVPRPATTRTTSSRSSSPTSPRWSRTRRRPACPTSFRVAPIKAELTQRRSRRVTRTCPASTRSITPAKAVKTLLNVDQVDPARRSSRWPACCSRRRCS